MFEETPQPWSKPSVGSQDQGQGYKVNKLEVSKQHLSKEAYTPNMNAVPRIYLYLNVIGLVKVGHTNRQTDRSKTKCT